MCLLITILVFWVDLFLICLWLTRLELFLKCSDFGSETRLVVLIKLFLNNSNNKNAWVEVVNSKSKGTKGNICQGS